MMNRIFLVMKVPGFFLALFLASLFVIEIPLGFSSTLPNRGELPVVLKGMRLIANSDYEEGFALFRQYIDKYPEHPSGYFFMAAAQELMMQYTNSDRGMAAFNKYSAKCFEIVQVHLQANPTDSISLFYFGALQGYVGLQEARKRNLLRAFRSAYNARRNLESALEINPDLYDVYLGLGMLYYYASKKHHEEGGLVGWFLKKFITHDQDLREKGMGMVKLAAEKGELSAVYGKRSLMWMFLLEKKYDEAYSMASEIEKESPHDKNSKWILARIELDRKDFARSYTHFMEIAQLVKNEKLDEEVYKDVVIGADLAKTGTHISQQDLDEAKSIIAEVQDWLSKNPTASIEFQDENDMFEEWKNLCIQYSEAIANPKNSQITSLD